jgi:hypothetical protein
MAYDQARTQAGQEPEASGRARLPRSLAVFCPRLAVRVLRGQHWVASESEHEQRMVAEETVMGQTLHLGMPTAIESAADRTPYAAVFEDDGKVAYFYGLDTRLGNQPVLDSVHVYLVSSILDHPTAELDVHEPCDVEIVWSADQERVALLLNGHPYAAFDFAAKHAYCKSNFPSTSRWSSAGHAWDDHAVDFLNASM